MGLAKGLSKDEKAQFVEAVTIRWRKWKDGRTDKEDVWDECFNAFISDFGDNTEIAEFRSQRYMPMAFEAIMNNVSQAGRGMFPNDDFFSAMGDNPTAKNYEKLRTIYMQNRMEASDFVEEYISSHAWQLFVFGNSPYMLGWDSRRSRFRNTYKQYSEESGQWEDQFGYEYQDSQGQQAYYNASPYTYDGPSFKVLDLYNYVKDPMSDDTTDGAIQIYRTLMSRAELLSQAEATYQGTDGEEYSTYDLKAVKEGLKGDDSAPDEASDSSHEERLQAFGITNTHKQNKVEDQVEVLWAHGDFAMGDKLYRDYIVCVLNRKHLIRCEPSPFKFGLSPLRMSSLIAVKGMPYGLGVLESALGLIDIINIRANQVIDAQALAINPPLQVRDDGVIDLDNLVWGPNELWLCEEMDNIKPAPVAQVAQIGLNENNYYKAELVDATFSHKNFGAQSRQQTATEVATSASMLATVMGRFIQRLENKDIKDILLWYDESEKQFFDPQSEVYARYNEQDAPMNPMTGEKEPFASITPEVIYQNYTWKAQGSGFTHLREIRLQQLFQWAIAAAQTPAAQDIDWKEVLKAALRDMGRRDSDKLIPGAKEILERAQQTGEIPSGPLAAAQGGPGGAGQAAPGSNNPAGLAPGGRGAIPNAGAGQIAASGQSLPVG